MAISTSKTEIYAEGTTNISWTNLQSNLGAQDPTNIRFGAYKRDTSDAEDPLIPDADENADIGTEESGNLRVGAFRGAIRDHTVTFDDASEYENVQFDKYFGANLIKNVPKNINVDGIVYSNSINKPAARIDTNDSVRNLTVGIGTSGAIYGAGGPSISEGPEGPIVQFNARYEQSAGSGSAIITIPEGVTSITYTLGGGGGETSPSGNSGLLSDNDASYPAIAGGLGQKLSGTLTGSLGGQSLLFRGKHFNGGLRGQAGARSSTSTFTDNRSSLSFTPGTGFNILDFYRTIDDSITSGTENHPVGTLTYTVEIADYADLDISVFPIDDQRRASGLEDPDESIELAYAPTKEVLSDRTRWTFAFQMNNSVVSGAKQATFVRTFAVGHVATGGSNGANGGAAASLSLQNGTILALAGGGGGAGGNQVNGSANPVPTTTNVIRTTADFNPSGCGVGADGEEHINSEFNSGGGGAGGGCPAGTRGVASSGGEAQKGGAGAPGEGLYDASFHSSAPTVTTSSQSGSYLEVSFSYQDSADFDGSIGVADAPITQNPTCDSAILYGWYTRTTNASTDGTSNINQLVIIWNGEVVYNESGGNISLTTDDGTAYSNWADGVEASGWSASDLSDYMFDGSLSNFAKAETSNTDFLGWSNSGTNLPGLQGPVEIYIKYADFANYSYEVNGSTVTPTLYSSPAGEADWLTISEGTVNSFRVTAPASNINVQIAAIRSNGVILTPTALYGGSGVRGVVVNGVRYSPLTHVHSVEGWHNDGTTCGTAGENNSEFTNGFNVVKKELPSSSSDYIYSNWTDGVEASGWFASDLSDYMFDGNLNRFSKAEVGDGTTDYLGWDNSGTSLATLTGPVEIYVKVPSTTTYSFSVNGSVVTPDLTGASDGGSWITLSTGNVDSFRVTSLQQGINVQIAAVRSNGDILIQSTAPSGKVEGITGGTALYLNSDINTRNFKINLESAGGSFGKLYGGGGGGITGDRGTPDVRTSCVRSEDNSYSYVEPRTCTGTAYNPTRWGYRNPDGAPSTQAQSTQPMVDGWEQSRHWDQRAENFCRNTYGGNSYGGRPQPGGGQGRNDYAGPERIPLRNGSPRLIQGVWVFECNRPGYYNPTYPGTAYSYTYGCSATIYVSQTRSDSGSITSPGGVGGPGGKGQGFQRAFEAGQSGETPTGTFCTSLGTLWSGPTATATSGAPGTSGGNWGEPGGSSDVATGGLAGHAYKKSNPSIQIDIIGGTTDRLKGRNN